MGLKALALPSYFAYNVNMRVWVYKFSSTLLSALVVLASAGSAFAQKQLKYVPQAIKAKPTIPYVLHPQLPPAVRTKFAMPVIRPNVPAQAAQGAEKIPASCPQRFVSFVRWLDHLQEKRLLSAKENTLKAIATLRNALIHYDDLSPADKPIINWLVIYLSKAHTALSVHTDGSWIQLVYRNPLPVDQLPRSEHFYLRNKAPGLKDTFFKAGKRPKRTQSFCFFRNQTNKEIIEGISLFQGFAPQDTGRELQKELSARFPQGYHVRMGPHELGLYDKNRERFRAGRLHLHLEANTPTPGVIPTDNIISLWVSAKPYAGVIDVQTRQIILPNNDQTIARNYAALFEPFLTPEGRAALQAIIEE